MAGLLSCPRLLLGHLHGLPTPSCLKLRLISTTTSKYQLGTPNKPGESVVVKNVGPVTTIGLNRPDKRNCVNPSTAKLLYDAFHSFEADDNAKVAILYGAGGHFCAGMDLAEVSRPDSKSVAFEAMSCLPRGGPMGPSRGMFKKPVIAAVSGYAVAGGMELALMCDLRVMEETACMGVFCRRFGVPLVDGGTVRLPALIGLSRALDLILTGRPIKAQEALEWGLANRVVATGTALQEAITLANALVNFPQECMLADRRSVYYSTYSASTYDDALSYELKNGMPIVEKESIQGAGRFVSGDGRHGKFHHEK